MDEADEMLNMGFLDSINAILSKVPQERKMLLFSATMPKEIEQIARTYMHEPKEVVVGSRNEGAENVRHVYYMAHAKDKYPALKRIADYYPSIYGIIFCRTRRETQEIADQLIRSSAIDIIVIDSVAALTPKAEIEGVMGEKQMGLQARLMSQALRKLTATISKTNTTCIFINQLRDKIGVMWGSPETTTGGNALKFYASVRLDIRRTSAIKNGEDVLGYQTKVKVVKNKVAPPFRKAEFELTFGEGVSHSGEILDLGVNLGIIAKSGSWFSYDGTKLGQGRDAVKRLIGDNPELAEELEAKIKAKLFHKDDADDSAEPTDAPAAE